MLPKGRSTPSCAQETVSCHQDTRPPQSHKSPAPQDRERPGLCDFPVFKYDARVPKKVKNLDPGLIVSTGEKVVEHCFSVPVNPGCPWLASLNGRVRAQVIKQITVPAGGHLPRNSGLLPANVSLPLAYCDVLPKPT